MDKNMKKELEKLKEKISIIKSKKEQFPSEKPIILIDQDDVLAELVIYVVNEFNKTYNTNYTIEDITCWQISKILGENVLDILFNPDIFRKLEPVPYSKVCLELLVESDLFNLQLVSAAKPDVCYNKFLWMQQEFPFFDSFNLNFSSNKYLFNGHVLLDDAPHNLECFKNGEAIVFDRPYNQIENNPQLAGLKRIFNWIEFTNYILDKFYPIN